MPINNSYFLGGSGGTGEMGERGIQGIPGNAGADSTVPGPQGDTGPVGPGTDLSHSLGDSTVQINSDTGTDTILQGASETLAGVMRAEDRIKLNGIPVGGFAPTFLGQSNVSVTTPLVLMATGITIPNELSWLLFQLNDLVEGLTKDKLIFWVDALTLYDAPTHNAGNTLLINNVAHPAFIFQGQREFYYVRNSANELLVTASVSSVAAAPLMVWGV